MHNAKIIIRRRTICHVSKFTPMMQAVIFNLEKHHKQVRWRVDSLFIRNGWFYLWNVRRRDAEIVSRILISNLTLKKVISGGQDRDLHYDGDWSEHTLYNTGIWSVYFSRLVAQRVLSCKQFENKCVDSMHSLKVLR